MCYLRHLKFHKEFCVCCSHLERRLEVFLLCDGLVRAISGGLHMTHNKHPRTTEAEAYRTRLSPVTQQTCEVMSAPFFSFSPLSCPSVCRANPRNKTRNNIKRLCLCALVTHVSQAPTNKSNQGSAFPITRTHIPHPV